MEAGWGGGRWHAVNMAVDPISSVLRVNVRWDHKQLYKVGQWVAI